MNRLFLGILIAIFFSGCKTDQKEIEIQPKIEKAQREFTVKIKYITNKVGEFKLALYNIVPNKSQNVWIQITEKVVATTAMENLTARFGENISNNFRIGLGKKEIREIQFEFIQVSYGEKVIKINPNQLSKYFEMNKFVTQDSITYKLKTQKVDGKLNPMIVLKKEYLIELKNQ